MANPATQIADLLLGNRTAGDIVSEQVAGAMPEKWKLATGTVLGLIVAGALLWIGASLAEGGWAHAKRWSN